MRRLKAGEVPVFRAERLNDQGGACSLCGQPVPRSEQVLDHCHKTGVCRGVLHRGCNTMLGKIENARVRYKLTDDTILHTLLTNVIAYISSGLDVLHPTHRTEEEKRLRRNAKARKRRQTKSGVENE